MKKQISFFVLIGLVNFMMTIGFLFIFDQFNTKLSAASSISETVPIQAPSGSLSPTPIPNDPEVEQKTSVSLESKNTNVIQVNKPVIPTDTPTVEKPSYDCLVIINGIRYDLGPFKKIHSGGDIFQCNTDMTDIFLGQHPESYLSQISQYRIK